MSKTIGNVIDPIVLINQYGADGLRLYFLKHFSPFSDGDFSEEKFKEAYNADLANGLGNLISRVAKLCENANYANTAKISFSSLPDEKLKMYKTFLETFQFHEALRLIWNQISDLDRYINDEKPWELAKTNPGKLPKVLSHAVAQIKEIAVLLTPFAPTSTEKILNQFTAERIVNLQPLFPRIS